MTGVTSSRVDFRPRRSLSESVADRRSAPRRRSMCVAVCNLAPFRIIEEFSMPATLDTIVAAARERVARMRRSADLSALERDAAEHQPRGFRDQLRRISQNEIAIIAELKKASPSRGPIRPDFSP